MTAGDVPGARRSGRFVRSRGLLWRSVDDSVVVLPSGSEAGEQPRVIAGSASVVWQLLASPISLEALAGELATCYDAAASEIAADLEVALRALQQAGLVEQLA